VKDDEWRWYKSHLRPCPVAEGTLSIPGGYVPLSGPAGKGEILGGHAEGRSGGQTTQEISRLFGDGAKKM